MKRFFLLAAGSALIFNAGCTPLLKEVRYTGGYPGYLLDKRTFNTSASKQLLLLRATLVLAMAAEMSRVTVRGEDGDAFAKHLSSAVAEINMTAADLYDTTDTKKVCASKQDDDTDCSGFYANFEGDIPLIEARIVKVMLAALPADKARKFLDDASKGNILGAAWSALTVIAKGAGGLHFAFARYRSGLELVAEHMDDRCVVGPKFDPATMTVIEAANCLGLSQDDLFSDPKMEADRDDLGSARNGAVSKGAFLALMRTIAAACVDLPYSGDVATIVDSRNLRGKACNPIGFVPTARPYRISKDAKEVVAGEDGTPANAPALIDPEKKSDSAPPAPIPTPS